MSKRRRTVEQNRKLHLLLQELDLISEKPTLAREFSGGRTEHTSQLYQRECQQLIDHLDRFAGEHIRSSDLMRKKVFVYCYRLNWISPPQCPEDYQHNRKTIDDFLLKRGVIRKKLSEYTYQELPRLLNQFEKIMKNNEASHYNKKVASMLNELGISVSLKVV